MKQRERDEQRAPRVRAELAATLAGLTEPAAVDAFLDDLCSPAELEALADRWSVVPLLAQGMPYRRIYEVTGVSVTTVGRIAKCLDGDVGGYRAALEHHPGREHGHPGREHPHPAGAGSGSGSIPA